MDQKRYYHGLIGRAIKYYGQECECCKEACIEHLTLHDTQGIPGESRRQLLHRSIRNKERGRYKVLCLNCVKGYREQGSCYHISE